MDAQTRALLQDAGLSAFESTLANEGVQRLEDLRHVGLDDNVLVGKLGMNRVQASKFREAVKASQGVVARAESSDLRRFSQSSHQTEGGESTSSGKQGKKKSFFSKVFLRKKSTKSSMPDETQSHGSMGGRSNSLYGGEFVSNGRELSPDVSGGGYRQGGHEKGQRNTVDPTLRLPVSIDDRPADWDRGQVEQAAVGCHTLLAYYKAAWDKKLPMSSIGNTKANIEHKSRYYYKEGIEVQFPYASSSGGGGGQDAQKVKAYGVKAIAEIRATVPQVMSALLFNDTDQMTTHMALLDGTFVNGQVLRVVSKLTPALPLCTYKRSCHSLPETRQLRDFVYRDYYSTEVFNRDQVVGVRSMVSVNPHECADRDEDGDERPVIRGTLFEGSGFVVVPKGKDMVDLCCIMIAETESKYRSGKGFRSSPKQRVLDQLEALCSVVDSVRVWVEGCTNKFGTLEEAQSRGAYPPSCDMASSEEDISPLSLKLVSSDNSLTAKSDDTLVEDEYYNDYDDDGRASDASSGALTPPPTSEEEVKARLQQAAEAARQANLANIERERELLRERERRLEEEERRIEAEKKKLAAAKAAGLSVVVTGDDSASVTPPASPPHSLTPPPGQEGGEWFEQEIQRMRRLLDKYREFLPKDVNEEDLDVTLEDAEKKMKDALMRMMGTEDPKEQMEAQSMFDKWDGIVQNHPEYKAREAKKEEQWELDQEPKNQAALDEMRKVVKLEYFGQHPSKLKDLGLTEALTKRINQKKILQLIYKSAEEINKLHPVALANNFSAQGLDIVELRAVYKCAPTEFTNDPDGKKTQWRANIRQKLKELVKKEGENKLRAAEKRSPAYSADADKIKPKFGGGGGGGVARGGGAAGRGKNHHPLAAMLAGRGAPRGGGPAAAAAGRGGHPLAAMLASRGAPRGGGLAAKGRGGHPLAAMLAGRGGRGGATAATAKKQTAPKPLSTAATAKKQTAPKPLSCPPTKVSDIDLKSALEKEFGGNSNSNPVAAAAPISPPSVVVVEETQKPSRPTSSSKARRVSDKDIFESLESQFTAAAAVKEKKQEKRLSKSPQSEELEQLLVQQSLVDTSSSSSSSSSKRTSTGKSSSAKRSDDWESDLMSNLSNQFK